jgi:hypothetical protein
MPHKIIYVLCPSFSITGGPEAAHQLVQTLRGYGHKAFLYFRPYNPDPTLLEYAEYDIRYKQKVDDNERNLLIALETMTEELRGYHRIRKAVWWLSVDNVLKLPKEKQFDWDQAGARDMLHFAQSDYAYECLKGRGVAQPMMLTDYLQAIHLERMTRVSKRDQIAYFEKKNAGAIEELIAAAPDLNWVPIKNMTPQQVKETLAASKVYVDLGPHPGRDRMPREAAMQECCVVIGNRGAAAYPKDYPFPERYKFNQSTQQPAAMIELLRSCLNDYETATSDFEGYRAWIRDQRNEFNREAGAIWGGKLCDRVSPHRIKARNYFVFYKNKVFKKLSGYRYPKETE